MGMLLRRHYEAATEKVTVDYSALNLKELKAEAKSKGVHGFSDMTKAELIQALEG